MPTARSGYELIAQQDGSDIDQQNGHNLHYGQNRPRNASVLAQPTAAHRLPLSVASNTSQNAKQVLRRNSYAGRTRSGSTGIDIKAINSRFEKYVYLFIYFFIYLFIYFFIRQFIFLPSRKITRFNILTFKGGQTKL